MKNYFFGFTLALFSMLSCSNDEDSIQNIDQILDIYIKDTAGNDLLHPSKVGAFTTISMNDNLAATDIATVSFSRKMTVDSTNFIQYVAGATRQLVNEINPDDKVYKSQIFVTLSKKISDTQMEAPIIDTLNIFYKMTPQVFEVSQIYYNSELKFTKVSNQPNIVTIIK